MLGNSSDPATDMVTGATSYRSPKRKRDTLDAEEHSPPASPNSTLSVTSHSEARLREEEDLGRYSPRTAVAGRLKDLVIHEGVFAGSIPHSLPITQWRSSSTPAPEIAGSSGQAEISQTSQKESQDHEVQKDNSESNIHDSGTRHLIHDSSQATEKTANAPAHHKGKVTLSPKSRKNNSPPPETAVPNPLTWSDSEITGHNPTDPSDDGYGINGIGFKPTAAIAWARSQKRQKQMTDWKTREAREAREKRRERREGMSQIKSEYDATGAAQKKVKFDLG